MNKLELLAPAKDAATAIAAITCGADAVYIGPNQFGARQAAGNSLDDIRQTLEFAHPYHTKVYATINTILRDDELAKAQKLIEQLYDLGIDGIIIQDTALLELDLPPVPVIASTQMNIDTPDKAEFFASLGLKRLILPRELSLDEITAIHQRTDVQLEAFVHGALCVGRSGQCYMSYALGGRSGNRGQCAQPCRKLYRLEDKQGHVIHPNAYLLSIMDMNRSDHLEQMIDAGITSFKIEGRLKNIPYVANITAYYRQLLDEIITRRNLAKASSGTVKLDFQPDPCRSFNRGFTSYNILGQQEKIGTPATPKSIGQPLGKVTRLHKNAFELDTDIQLNNADGICFIDQTGKPVGTIINRVDGKKVTPNDLTGLYVDCHVYRNNDQKFNQLLNKVPAQRKISIDMELTESGNSLILTATDEGNITAQAELPCTKEPARNVDAARNNLQTQLIKLGNTIFTCNSLTINLKGTYFISVSQLNSLRRQVVENLLQQRCQNRPTETATIQKNDTPYPQTNLNFTANILNEKARQFYLRHNVEKTSPAAESGLDLTGQILMNTRYCIRKQLNLCQKPHAEDLYLRDEQGNRFKLQFDCTRCGMNIIKDD